MDDLENPLERFFDKETIEILIRAHRLFREMAHYPELLEEMRERFASVLAEKGLELENLRQRIRRTLQPPEGQVSEEYAGALLDLFTVTHLSDEEIQNYLNLIRKKERLRVLTRVVNSEGVTSLAIKNALRAFCEIPEGQVYVSPNEAEGVRVALINHFISNQLPFIGIAKQHITIRDIDEMVEHSYWSPRHPGRIGGKAAGLLLAYRIVLPRLEKRDPDLERYVRVPESYYFNSGVFSEFIEYNDLDSFHAQKYKSEEDIEEEYRALPGLIEKTSFPPRLMEMFKSFLQRIGPHPLILRSSSLLEDNFGYSFSGKYESVFISNQGDLESRLAEFADGLKRVHMSVCAPAPILYRKEHRLLDFDERMSVLVQRLVGRRFGEYFFPFASGVAFSHNSYAWTPRIRREDGLVRLVFGLGTRAVDRVGEDYPRMIPLSNPLLRPEVGADQVGKFSQKMVDVFNLRTKRIETLSFLDLLGRVDHPDLYYAFSINRGGHLWTPMFKTQEIDFERGYLTFDNLLTRTPFVELMKRILKALETAYGQPVDVEFAWDEGKLYLLQCRTLSIGKDSEVVSIPSDAVAENILFTNNKGVSNGLIRKIEYIVYVDPKAYRSLPTRDEKILVGRIVGRINKILAGKRYALFGPGRWGSNEIDLGVRVGYKDINKTLVLGEIAFEEGGSAPEVSYGTHFFNDLVEAQITPLALYPDQPDTVFNLDFFLRSANRLAQLIPEFASHSSVVRVIHVPSSAGGKVLDIYQDGRGQRGMGLLSDPQDQDGSTSA